MPLCLYCANRLWSYKLCVVCMRRSSYTSSTPHSSTQQHPHKPAQTHRRHCTPLSARASGESSRAFPPQAVWLRAHTTAHTGVLLCFLLLPLSQPLNAFTLPDFAHTHTSYLFTFSLCTCVQALAAVLGQSLSALTLTDCSLTDSTLHALVCSSDCLPHLQQVRGGV